jgi:hypothetical protein
MGKYGPFMAIEIKNYYVSLNAGGKKNINSKLYRAIISLRDKDGFPFASALFFEGEAPMPDTDTQNSDGYITMNFKSEDFPRVLDILRNEKPVYVWYNKNFEMASINTSAFEPIGDGEDK